jgi:hypothetical protein
MSLSAGLQTPGSPVGRGQNRVLPSVSTSDLWSLVSR